MKAIVCTKYGPPDVLQLKEVAKPAPRDNEVLIKIYATAVTASDCIIRGFKVPLRLWLPMRLALGFTKPRKPILGMVLAGEIESVGKDVKRFKKGDQVYAFNVCDLGRMPSTPACRKTSVLALKPSNVTYEEAAAVPYGGLLALYFLRKGKHPKRTKSAYLWSFRSGRYFCGTACQALWGRSYRGMQYDEFRIREISGSRYGH